MRTKIMNAPARISMLTAIAVGVALLLGGCKTDPDSDPCARVGDSPMEQDVCRSVQSAK